MGGTKVPYRVALAILLFAVVTLHAGSVSWANETLQGASSSASSGAEVLSLEQAVNRALTLSRTLKIAELNLQAAENSRREAAAAFNPLWLVNYTPGTETAYAAFLTSNASWQSAQTNYDMEKDTVVASIYRAYYDVLLVEKEIEVKKALLEAVEAQLSASRYGFKVGTITRNTLAQLEARYMSAKSDLAAGQRRLDEAYRKLNELVGLPPGGRPLLVMEVAYEPVAGEGSFAVDIDEIVSSSPTVLNALRTAELRERLIGLTGDYETSKIDAEKARIQVDQLREDLKTQVKSLYNNLLLLEDQYAATVDALRAAEDFLKIVGLRKNLGMATESELKTAEADVLNLRYTLFKLTVQHELTKLAFFKPWAGSGSGSSAAGSAQAAGR